MDSGSTASPSDRSSPSSASSTQGADERLDLLRHTAMRVAAARQASGRLTDLTVTSWTEGGPEDAKVQHIIRLTPGGVFKHVCADVIFQGPNRDRVHVNECEAPFRLADLNSQQRIEIVMSLNCALATLGETARRRGDLVPDRGSDHRMVRLPTPRSR